ncbi:MAG: SUMF1/EgtB/PvdO family nonheme iron enzyme [Hydrogenophaga sp.]|uniref:selenoneine synthase SenA n=1 Tax=Hydrogenophaga sp. TaxID=1904254 RepID=UPI002628E3C7|nr:selenoneine synthase SenA [Hydrogenophaga sp.]MCV0439366.1 SUMF1/EgtB/PvdO family nonheme iron enzyme [Hydrogenophaga sp.]
MDAARDAIVSQALPGNGLEADHARQGGRDLLVRALVDARARSLRLFAAFEAALGPGLPVPCMPEINPPLWELGHVGWFADWWIARNPQRLRGARADPLAPRNPARQAARGLDADALYDSSAVAHDTRWHLDLPDTDAVRADLAASLRDTLALLHQTDETDDALYFFRLALFHEDMHAEAAVYMAQSLGIDVGETPAATAAAATAAATLHLPLTRGVLGHSNAGFAFDNELGAHAVSVGPLEIDARALRWSQYLPLVETGGAPVPRHLRRAGTGWECCRFGRWQALDLDAATCHLSAAEALAWCAWAGRRLPTEAEWELAARTLPGFAWGEVWEWTASEFAPYPGFAPHPYRDYSQPWFDGRPVLKGASFATAARLRHPVYRNFFPPARNDIFAGFRSVAR